MASHDDVRRIALALPETVENDDRFAFEIVVKGRRKGIAWTWYERVHLAPKALRERLDLRRPTPA